MVLCCLCHLRTARTNRAGWNWGGGGGGDDVTAHGSLGADFCKLHDKLHSGLPCTLSQSKQ